MRSSKVLVLECEDAEKWRGLTLEMWRRLLCRPDEQWEVGVPHPLNTLVRTHAPSTHTRT